MPPEIPARPAGKITCLAPWFLVCLMVAGCAPKDPLDWKISADTPDDFNIWCQRKTDRLPQNLIIELNTSFEIISNEVEPNRAVVHDNGYDPFCQRVNHHTIRDIIVDAYQIADESLLGEMIRTQDAKINNINRSTSVGTVAEQDRFKQTIDYQQKRIDELDKELRHNRARIKELEPDLDSK
jgi:hypothetical protein